MKAALLVLFLALPALGDSVSMAGYAGSPVRLVTVAVTPKGATNASLTSPTSYAAAASYISYGYIQLPIGYAKRGSQPACLYVPFVVPGLNNAAKTNVYDAASYTEANMLKLWKAGQ